jgi:hypothetical protein
MSFTENVELKKMVSRLEYSILDLGGNISDDNVKYEGKRVMPCGECTLL